MNRILNFSNSCNALEVNKIKKSPLGRFFVISNQGAYLAKSSNILALSSLPLKSFATTLPEASSMNVAGMDCTSYWAAMGSFQNFKWETCVQVNLSFAMASFHFAASLSKETPTILSPLGCSSL